MNNKAAKPQVQTSINQETECRRVRIYPRTSSDEQKENETIENQVEFALKYCDLYKFTIVDWYKDDGVSGTIPLEERTEGKRLLDDLRNDPEPCLVLVFNIKRLGRGARIILNAVYDIEQAGATVRSMTEPFDTQTPYGRFILTILAGEAGFDRESLLYNMWLGANRCATKGQWLGGIVPYGYRVVNKFLEVNEDPIPGFDRSEADIIRLIYYQVAELHQSTIQVADYLNLLHAPTAYVRAGRLVEKGKRKVATSGVWLPGRVRNIIVNPTYKGVHFYGKRTTKQRELIERKVPWIVSAEQWNRAQEVLRENQIEATRNAKRQYLLRGLIKCGLCGLTYIGTAYKSHGKTNRVIPYYRCDGKQIYRGPLSGRCQSKNIPQEWIDELVWNDCVNFILNPGDAVKEIAASMEEQKNQRESLEAEKQLLIKTMQDKETEKQRIISLYRKNIINIRDVEAQIQAIMAEKEQLSHKVHKLDAAIAAEELAQENANSVEELLGRFRSVIEGEPTFEDKRRIVCCLVKEIKVDTILDDPDHLEAKISVIYNFAKDTPRTGRDSLPQPA